MVRFGTSYYPEHTERSEWPRDLDNMAELGLELVRVAEFAWASGRACSVTPPPALQITTDSSPL